MALLRVLLVALVFQTVVFVSLWFYAKARRREWLQQDWAASEKTQTLDTYLLTGKKAFEARLLRQLIIGVYLVPSGLLTLLIYLTSSD